MPSSPIAHAVLRSLLRLQVLGLLQSVPRHGLDLARAVEERNGGHWRPGPGTLYPALGRMERDGLIEGRWEPSQAAPRRVYSLTDAGRLARLSLRRKVLEELLLTRDLVQAQVDRIESESGPGQRRLWEAKEEDA